jgi:hypothetical protein
MTFCTVLAAMQRGGTGLAVEKSNPMNAIPKQMSGDDKETLEWVECIPIKDACGEDDRFMRD